MTINNFKADRNLSFVELLVTNSCENEAKGKFTDIKIDGWLLFNMMVDFYFR